MIPNSHRCENTACLRGIDSAYRIINLYKRNGSIIMSVIKIVPINGSWLFMKQKNIINRYTDMYNPYSIAYFVRETGLLFSIFVSISNLCK